MPGTTSPPGLYSPTLAAITVRQQFLAESIFRVNLIRPMPIFFSVNPLITTSIPSNRIFPVADHTRDLECVSVGSLETFYPQGSKFKPFPYFLVKDDLTGIGGHF